MGVPTGGVDAPGVVSPSEVRPSNASALPADFGDQMARGFAPVLQGLQDSVAAVVAAAKKRAKADSDSSSDEEDEARLEKLCMFGGLQVAKKKKMNVSDFQRENEVEKIRSAQRIRHLKGVGKWELLWNQTLEEQTALMIQLEKIQHEKFKGKLKASAIAMAASYERTLYTQLMGLTEKIEILGECVLLSGSVKGGAEEADALYSLYSEKLSGCSESKLLIKLRAETKVKLKWRKEMSMLEAVSQMGASAGKVQVNGSSEWKGSVQKPQANEPRGKGGGKGGGSREFTMEWVDATAFDSSLTGVKAPSPSKFPGYFQARLDSSTKGMVHTAGWRGECGACGEAGHSHSECPARKWSANGQEYVNVRWLYDKGFCNAQGAPK